MAEFSSVS